MPKHILNTDSKALQAITHKLNELKQLSSLFEQEVEPTLAKHCQIVGIDKGCLMVMVDNGHWATQLRFQIPTLLSRLRLNPRLQNLKGIICKTHPSYSTVITRQPKQPRKITRISHQTADIILSIAQTIPDSRLRSVLERIARNFQL